jgi:hypothetical protein
MANYRFKERAKTHDGVTTYARASLDLGAETSDILTTAYYNMKNYDSILGVIALKSVVATHIITMRMLQGSDTDGAGSATITGASAAYTSSQVTDDAAYVLEVDADMLTDGLDYVGLEVSTDDPNGVEAIGIVVIPCSTRYAQATPPA